MVHAVNKNQNDPSNVKTVADNVLKIRQRISRAAKKSGRTGSDVRLIAVSKYAEPGDGMIEALLASNCTEFGEARPQRLLDKAKYYSGMPIQWHFIGPLQRNKVRKILPITTLIQSLDSLRLAEAIHRVAEEEQLPPVRCLLEIAISQDKEKHGIEPAHVLEVLDKMGAYNNVIVEGLMGMAGLESEEPQIRKEFERLRRTAESAQERGLPPNVLLSELSMGMSGDFEMAIEEGATIVRIGSVLYPHQEQYLLGLNDHKAFAGN